MVYLSIFCLHWVDDHDKCRWKCPWIVWGSLTSVTVLQVFASSGPDPPAEEKAPTPSVGIEWIYETLGFFFRESWDKLLGTQGDRKPYFTHQQCTYQEFGSWYESSQNVLIFLAALLRGEFLLIRFCSVGCVCVYVCVYVCVCVCVCVWLPGVSKIRCIFDTFEKMNVTFVTWYFEMLSDAADSEFTPLDTIPSTACCPKDPGLGVILTPGGPRQGWSEEDEEGQIFWDAKKWICWSESVVLGAWISPPPPKKKQTPEMMSTGAVDVHVLFLNFWETSIRCL